MTSGNLAYNKYTALTIVSPMRFGEHKKDQDRARWYEPGQTACICDGVSSSPSSQQAADMVTSFIPILLNGNVFKKFTLLCDLLTAYRQELQQSREIVLPKDTPPSMQPMLGKVIQQKLAASFQTTVVAARFSSHEQKVVAQVIICGDSAFFAFSPVGELLSSSLKFTANSTQKDSAARPDPSSPRNNTTFGPGSEILVRVEGPLSKHIASAANTGVSPEHRKNWLVCSVVDGCRDGDGACPQNLSQLKTFTLRYGDLLLVPRYLYGTQLTSENRQYRVMKYSSTIRPLPTPDPAVPTNQFGVHGSATRVLPDHFYGGFYDSYQDTLPAETQFVLCSDGFYSCFTGGHELWSWLAENADRLKHQEVKETVLSELHQHLYNQNGDDDISFVWVKPRTSEHSAENNYCAR